MKGDDFLSCCGNNKKGCSGGCAGHCNEDILNAVTELEIYYSEREDSRSICTFDNLYCITNTQMRQLKLTGLEGTRYESLDKLKTQVIERLIEENSSACESYSNADIVFIRNNDSV